MDNAPASDDPRLQPFDLGSGPTVLLIHGFTGTPFEMRFLGERLASRGYRAKGVRLPGHGLDPEELERANGMDWVNEAREALLSLPEGEQAFVVGLSMGGLIGAILAADHPHRVRGLVMAAPPLFLRPKNQLLLEVGRLGFVAERVRFIPKRGSDLSDEEMRAQNPCIDKIPALAADQFAKIMGLGRVALPKVRCPALILYSTRDRTVPPAAALEAAKLVGSRPARVVKLTRSCHVLTLDVEREKVALEIEKFLRTLEGRPDQETAWPGTSSP